MVINPMVRWIVADCLSQTGGAWQAFSPDLVMGSTDRQLMHDYAPIRLRQFHQRKLTHRSVSVFPSATLSELRRDQFARIVGIDVVAGFLSFWQLDLFTRQGFVGNAAEQMREDV